MTTAEQRPINPPHVAPLLPSNRLGWIVTCAWTALIVAIFVWVIHEVREMSLELASNEARANFDKDQALRRWGSSHGGIYVPVSELSRPSPYLAHVRGRDVVTTDGKHLTLLDPATMVRQLEGYAGLRDVAGRIVNRSPLNPANRPDEWELGALRAFEAGTAELRELISKDGKPYLRYMRAMRANESCLRCHGHQGYQAGAIVGGVGVTVALEPFFAREREEILDEARYFGFIWILGLVGIGTGTRRIARYSSEREQAEQSLRASEERYMLAARGANDGLWDWNLASSEVYYSPRWQQIFGYADGGIGTSPEEWMKRVHPDDRESLSSALEAHICGGTEHSSTNTGYSMPTATTCGYWRADLPSVMPPARHCAWPARSLTSPIASTQRLKLCTMRCMTASPDCPTACCSPIACNGCWRAPNALLLTRSRYCSSTSTGSRP